LNTKTGFFKKFIMLALALVLVIPFIAGCSGDTEETKATIRFPDRQWESVWLSNSVAQFIIEEGYGYPTEVIQMDTPVMQVAILKGEIDVDLEAWQQNFPDWYEEHSANGNIETLGYSLEGGPQFWCIPQWVHDEYGIDTVEDMKDNWELFKDPEDPSKGLFINSMVGWACTEINEIKFEAYGLDEFYNMITPGTSGAETAALAGPQMKSEPVFGYYWSPTPLMGMYDWYVLEEPAYDAEVWAKIQAAVDDPSIRPIDEACAFESVPLAIIANKDFRSKAPDVAAMLENFEIGLDRCNKTLAWAETNEVQDWEKAAVWFLREYDSHWKPWVPADIYTKVKAALDAYGNLP
jgi:glycine betaine/proline transport system substrate-binding protein